MKYVVLVVVALIGFQLLTGVRFGRGDDAQRPPGLGPPTHICKDGSPSWADGPGTCSWHGGIDH
jgi:hypothetical protein